MISDFAEQLYIELNEELEVFSDLGTTPVKKVTGKIKSIQAAFDKLKAFIDKHGFDSPEAEIHFFKYHKPRFIAEQLYAMELFTIEEGCPIGDEEMQMTFYKLELKYIERFLFQYRSLYQYYQREDTGSDHAYFLRESVQNSFMLLPDILEPNPNFDPLFSTGFDYLFGRFIAAERMQKFLSLKLSPNGALILSPTKKKVSLPYTGEAIELVEIIYGLYHTGRVKHGKASLTQLFLLFEEMFEIKLGTPNRRWSAIASRKRLSITRFLDELKAALLKRVDDDNAK